MQRTGGTFLRQALASAWSTEHVAVMRRDSSVMRRPPKARLALRLQTVPSEMAYEAMTDDARLDRRSRHHRRQRRTLAEAGVGVVYAARDNVGDIAHLVWALDAVDVQSAPDVCLVRAAPQEPGAITFVGAYTLEGHRRLGVAAESIARISALLEQRPTLSRLFAVLPYDDPGCACAAAAAGFETLRVLTIRSRLGWQSVYQQGHGALGTLRGLPA